MNGPSQDDTDYRSRSQLTETYSVPRPFVETIRERSRAVDLVLLLAPVFLLVSLFLLPRAIRYTLAFDATNPTLRSAFTANFVHLARSHLLSNVAGYLLLVSVIYLLAVANENRRRFQLFLVVILLGFPVPLSYLSSVLDFPGIVLGFSGLNMAILGYGVVELSGYIGRYVTDHFGVENAPGFFFLATTFIGAMYAESPIGFTFLGVSALIALLYWVEVLPSLGFLLAGSKRILDQPGYVELLIAGTLLLAGFVLAAFPEDPVRHSGIVNIYLHFVGFAMGFISTYVCAMVDAFVRTDGE